MPKESIILPKSPSVVVTEIKQYVQSKGVDTDLIEHGLTHPDYLGIRTISSEAVGYACSLAEFQGFKLASVPDVPFHEEIIDALFFQLLTEDGVKGDSKRDYEELLHRTEATPLFLIIQTEGGRYSQRRGTNQFIKNPFDQFLKRITQRENVRIIVYGNDTPDGLNGKLLFVPQNETLRQENKNYGLSTSSSTSSGVVGFTS